MHGMLYIKTFIAVGSYTSELGCTPTQIEKFQTYILRAKWAWEESQLSHLEKANHEFS